MAYTLVTGITALALVAVMIIVLLSNTPRAELDERSIPDEARGDPERNLDGLAPQSWTPEQLELMRRADEPMDS